MSEHKKFQLKAQNLGLRSEDFGLTKQNHMGKNITVTGFDATNAQQMSIKMARIEQEEYASGQGASFLLWLHVSS